jgi:hypothetical protein
VAGVYTWVSVSGSNGFALYDESWSDTIVAVQGPDPEPGQSYQARTYTAVGEVVWWLCYEWWGPHCVRPEEYIEQGSAQTSVTPTPPPSLSGVTPGSGTIGTAVTLSGPASPAAGP